MTDDRGSHESGAGTDRLLGKREEALFLADRVVVQSGRPARIVDTVEVAVPHPRRRDEHEFVVLRRRVLDLLGVDENEAAAPKSWR